MDFDRSEWKGDCQFNNHVYLIKVMSNHKDIPKAKAAAVTKKIAATSDEDNIDIQVWATKVFVVLIGSGIWVAFYLWYTSTPLAILKWSSWCLYIFLLVPAVVWMTKVWTTHKCILSRKILLHFHLISKSIDPSNVFNISRPASVRGTHPLHSNPSAIVFTSKQPLQSRSMSSTTHHFQWHQLRVPRHHCHVSRCTRC